MRGVVMALVYLTAAACASEAPSAPSAPTKAAIPGASAGEPLVVFLGDSLTAGYGLSADQAFPSLVAEALRQRGRPVRIVNAGVSGDTTTGALERLDWLLDQKPAVLVVGLGANDAFRGQPVGRIEENLREIARRGRAAGARVVLLGMRVPTNYGPDYANAFASMYARIARDEKLVLMPFLLDGVGGHAELNQDDGIHPNENGQRIVAANVLPYVVRAIEGTR
jgi:acyl-CoA thioesterase-1